MRNVIFRWFLAGFASVVVFADKSASAQLIMNEVQPKNDTTLADGAGEFDDWIEIHNSGNASIDLAGYYVTDDPSAPLKWQIPATDASLTTVPANGFRILWADDDEETQGADHLSFKLSPGETVVLSAPDGSLIDSLSLPANMSEDESLGRFPDGGADLVVFPVPSPDVSNNNSQPQTEVATFSPPGGFFPNAVTVTLSGQPGATIYFTTDGSEPTSASSIYGGPILITNTSPLRAMSVIPGYAASPVDTESYFIGVDHETAVVAINMDPEHLWSDDKGIYVVGTNGTIGDCLRTPANYMQEWEYPGNVIMFDEQGSKAFDVDGGISIFGNCSRRQAQKGLQLKTKREYPSENIPYAVFPEVDQHEYRRLRFRPGGDWRNSMLRDVVSHRLVENKLPLEIQSARPSVVYLNGEYWGVHNIRDPYSEHYFRYKFPDYQDHDFDIIRIRESYSTFVAVDGTTNAIHSLFQFFEDNAVFDQADYEAAKSMMDVSNFLDYNLLHMWVFPRDWPATFSPSNMIYWRSIDASSKWRFAVLDLDVGWIGPEHDTVSYMMIPNESARNNERATLLFRRLMQVPEFKAEFLQRYATQLNLLYSPAVVNATIDEYASQMAPEMEGHTARWGAENKRITNVAAWVAEVDANKEYANQRADFMRHYITNFFGIGTFQLSFNVDGNSNGRVVINGNDYLVPDNYSGPYFTDTPVEIRAIPKPGYRFVRWQETGQTSATLYDSYHADTALTPVFEPALDLIINEIHYHPSVTNADEFVELHNPDSHALDISGYTFTNGLQFTFPPDTIIGAGEFLIVAADASRHAGAGYHVFEWAYSGLDNGGERLSLATVAGDLLASVRYNDKDPWPEDADGLGGSLELRDPALDPALPENWQASTVFGGTPGAPNSVPSGVVINEVMSRDVAGPEWIELHNTSAGTVDVGGWFVGSQLDAPYTPNYQIPPGTSIPAGGYLLLDQLGFDLADTGTDLFLARGANGQLIGFEDIEDVGVANPGVSFGRWRRSDGEVDVPPLSTPTPGAANASPLVPALRITELMAKPELGKAEYIQLSNTTGLPQPLYDPASPGSSWAFTDGVEYSFPILTSIEPCETIYVCDTQPALFRAQYGIPFETRVFGPWTGQLNNGGETVKLRQPVAALPDGSVPLALAEKIAYDDAAPWAVTATNHVLTRAIGDLYSNDPGSWSVGSPAPVDYPCADLPPVLSAAAAESIPEKVPFQLQLNAADPENDPFIFSLDGAPNGASITPSGLFSWTPTEAQGPGVYAFEVVITETSAVPRSDRKSWAITVLDVNEPPVLTPPVAETIPEELPFQQQLTATDPDGDSLTFSLDGAPAGASISASGLFNWEPTEAQGPGTYTFDVVITETIAQPLSDRESWSITVLDINEPPLFAPLPTRTIPEEALFQVALAASDPDGDGFVFSISGEPVGVSLSPSGVFTWLPSNAQGGQTYNFTVTVTDQTPEALSVSRDWTIAVTEVNDPPQFPADHSEAINENTVWTFQAGGTDPEGEALVYSVQGAPSGLVFDPDSGWMRWLPAGTAGGQSYSFEVVAEDPAGETATRVISLSVRDMPQLGGGNCTIQEPLIQSGAVWSWRQNLSSAFWAEPWFPLLDSSAWIPAATPAGYGESGLASSLPGGVTRTLFRHSFSIQDRHEISSLGFRFQRDDGIVAYLNGIEVARDNLPAGPLTASTTATSSVFGSGETAWKTVSIPISALAEGDNELTVAIHQITASSSDMRFNAELVAQRQGPCAEIRLDPEVYAASGALRWNSDPGAVYVVERCFDLPGAVWEPLQTVTANASMTEVMPTDVPGGVHSNVHCFFRITRQ